MTDAGERARVLIVDDSRLDRELSEGALERVARIECCASAEEALEALRREPADLVLSDLTMPGLSGLELLERVRREHPRTEFILVTAHASVDSAVEALRMGAADYLRKPVHADELALVVTRTLERRRLIEDNARLGDLLATVEACRALAPCLEPGEVYPVALDILLGALGRGRGVAVFSRSPTHGSDGVAFRGLGEEVAALRTLLVDEKRIDLDGFDRLTVAASGPIHDALRAAGIGVGRMLVIPLHGEESESGVLAVFEDRGPFSSAELERARMVAGHAGIALRNAERYQQAKERAFVDDVTGVYNARYLFTALEHEIRRAQRYGTELTVLFLDLDRFKLVNDTHGHLVGSQTLRRLADVLRQCIRQVDTLARYGGDEFTILLADTPLDTGLRIAERIRGAVADARFETRTDRPLHIEVSVGVAAYPTHARAPEQLIDLADKAMYRAKSLGRNRVCSASELDG
jgi:diguanylate cyclase (GGDEF)-like protein